ncbi:hypothetical protein QUF54_01930, partial [Candidatus Marithioploca araucensis]|nr:hypothetical protein [Candidatus Marithioploca araucensis]
AETIRNRLIFAQFPKKTLDKIHTGQRALIRLDRTGKQTIQATVINVEQKKASVELRAEINATVPNPFQKGEGGEVKIEVEHVTPAVLVLRASGLLTETPPLSSSQRY